MAAIFYAIYDDSAVTIPFKIVHKNPVTIYRTSNMELIEEISAMGYEPKAVLLEEDIDSVKNGSYANDDATADELKFLMDSVGQWSYPPTAPTASP